MQQPAEVEDFLTEEQVKNNSNNKIPLHREGAAGDAASAICMPINNKLLPVKIVLLTAA